MLLMMAWMFWFFCGEEKKKDDEGIASNGVNSMIVENTSATHLKHNKTHTKNNKIVEENIDISFINFDECENYDIELDNFPMEENILPTTIAFDQNYDFNDFDANDGNVDYEVSSATTADNEEEVMKASLLRNRMNSLESYQGRVSDVGGHASSSTKLNIHTNSSVEAAGRIHSVVVRKGEENHDLRVRSTSPMVCIHPEHSIHDGHKGYEGFAKEELQYKISVGKTSVDEIPVDESCIIPVNVNFSNASPNSNEYVVKPIKENTDQSSGGSLARDKKEIDLKFNSGKLKKSTLHKNIETSSKSPSTKLTDFDTVMKSRKLHTDTMDITANVLGNLGHRKEKIQGSNRKVSKNWARLQNAVLKRQFLSFKDVPLPTDSSK